MVKPAFFSTPNATYIRFKDNFQRIFWLPLYITSIVYTILQFDGVFVVNDYHCSVYFQITIAWPVSYKKKPNIFNKKRTFSIVVNTSGMLLSAYIFPFQLQCHGIEYTKYLTPYSKFLSWIIISGVF